MKQGSLSEVGFVQRKRPTRRAVFLERMEAAVPWGRFGALILPHYPVAGKGRRPYPLGTMLRVHLMQQWLGFLIRRWRSEAAQPIRGMGENRLVGDAAAARVCGD